MEEIDAPTASAGRLDTLRIAYVQSKEDFRLATKSAFSLVLIFLGITAVAVRLFPDPSLPIRMKIIVSCISVVLGIFEATVGIILFRWLRHNEKCLESLCIELGLPCDRTHTTLAQAVYVAYGALMLTVLAWIIMFIIS